MTQAVGAGGTATYTYNGDGLKVQRVGPDGAIRYYYDGIRPIWETDGAGAMTAQLDRDIFGNLLSRQEANGTHRYYHPDGLGSTIALTDETGSVVASTLYDAWGQVRASNGTGQGKYRYIGAELDEATGLYHMGARFYDPSIGRWLSEDPAQSFEPMSLNFYAYVANNPLVLIDPTGMTSTGPEGGGCGGDLGCLNEQRQAAAMGALALEALTGADSVETYKDYLADSRTRGHTAAMADLVGKILEAAASIMPSGDFLLASTGATADQITEQYVTASRLAGTGILLMALGAGVAATVPSTPGFVIGLNAFGWGAWRYSRGFALAETATMNDIQYFGGQVWESLDPAVREFIDRIFLPHP